MYPISKQEVGHSLFDKMLFAGFLIIHPPSITLKLHTVIGSQHTHSASKLIQQEYIIHHELPHCGSRYRRR
jgi:hypothetical protein